MANVTLNLIDGTTATVDAATITMAKAGRNAVTCEVYTGGLVALEILGTLAATKTAIVAAGRTATAHYTPQFDDYWTFS